MGMFAVTVFVRNQENLKQEQIISELSAYMESQGFVQCEENQKEKTFCLSFPEGKWFAVGSREERLSFTAKECTKIFHAYAVTANLVDSDFVMLELFNPDSHVIDHQTIGTPYWEEEPETELAVSEWTAFLKQDAEEQDLISALQADEVFAEDAFGTFGELIELDTSPLYIEWNENSEEVTAVYFRKK